MSTDRNSSSNRSEMMRSETMNNAGNWREGELSIADLIDAVIGDDDAVTAYETAEHGERFGVYADGSWSVGQDVGREIAGDERPVVMVTCMGLGNADSSVYTDGVYDWDEEQEAYVVAPESRMEDVGRVVGDLEDVVAECVADGDGRIQENMKARLLEAARDND